MGNNGELSVILEAEPAVTKFTGTGRKRESTCDGRGPRYLCV